MSLILEALRKPEAERRRGQAGRQRHVADKGRQPLGQGAVLWLLQQVPHVAVQVTVVDPQPVLAPSSRFLRLLVTRP